MVTNNIVAIIGGSGVKETSLVDESRWKEYKTGISKGFGDGLVHYQWIDDGVLFIPRHGRKHFEEGKGDISLKKEEGKWIVDNTFGPAQTQYGANLVTAMRKGAIIVLGTTAVGSYNSGISYKITGAIRNRLDKLLNGKNRELLNEICEEYFLLRREIPVGSLVVPDDYDNQTGRSDDIFTRGLVVHTKPEPAFSEDVRKIIYHAAIEHEQAFSSVHYGGTCVIIPGNRFGTRAERRRRRKNADIAGMTLIEAAIAMGMGLLYGSAAFVVDKDRDANHEGGTMEVMADLSQEHKVPAFITTATSYLKEYEINPKELNQNLRGNIIPANTSRLQNPTLEQIAEATIAKYCK